MMIHKGIKPFQCNICQKKFREKSNYNFHLKNHIKKLGKGDKNEINKSNSFSKNEIDFKGIERINIGNEFDENKAFLKKQDTLLKSNNNNLKYSGNDNIINNNQIEVKNKKNKFDNNEIINLEKDHVMNNLSNIFNQIDSDIIALNEQKRSTYENSYLFNDNNIFQKYNICEQNNAYNTPNLFNNEDLYLNNPNNINKLELMFQNNNIELEIKNKVNDDDTYLLVFP